MGYNINFDDLRNMYEKAISGSSMWQGNFSNVIESLNGLISDDGFSGETASAIKEYLNDVHVFTMTAIESMIAEFNAKIILYADGLYAYEGDYYAIVNEDYLTALAGKIGDMITCVSDTQQIVKTNVDDVANYVTTNVKGLESYTASLEAAQKTVTDFRDNIGNHDAEFSGVNLENLKALVQNTYDLVEKIHNVGTITIGDVSIKNYCTLEKIQEIANEISVSSEYVTANLPQINNSAKHLSDIRVEINKELAEQAKKDRITNGVILIGECVLGLASVVVTCGADTPAVIAGITAGVGTFVAVDSLAKGSEGIQDIYYGINGDIETQSINFVRDSVFNGNQTNYDVSMMIVNGMFAISGSMSTLASVGSIGSAEQITAAEIEVVKAVGNTGVDHLTNYYVEHSNMGDLGKFVTSTIAGIAGGMLIDGAGNILDTKLFQINSTHFYSTDQTSFHLNHVDFEKTVSISDANVPTEVNPIVRARTSRNLEHVSVDVDSTAVQSDISICDSEFKPGKYSAFGEMSDEDGARYTEWNFSKIKEMSVHNPESSSMTLGKYFDGTIESGSYVAYAEQTGDTYFSLGTQWDDIEDAYNLNNQQMFEIFNTNALDEAVKNGKKIRFTQNQEIGLIQH